MAKTEKAQFGMGCFWHPDDYFAKLSGVVSTRVGYEGGDTPNPTYEDLHNHTETTEIEYDPEKISYKELLRHFFAQHDPTTPLKTQYRSVIFTQTDEQRAAARQAVTEMQQELNKVNAAGREGALGYKVNAAGREGALGYKVNAAGREGALGYKDIQTAVESAGSFTEAEEYHQKFLAKQRGEMT